MQKDVLVNVADYARAARRRLAKDVSDYYEGGALDEITLRENTASWEKLKLYYHVLAGSGQGGEDAVHFELALEHGHGTSLGRGGEPSLVSALYIQGPGDHPRVGATS